MNQIVPAASVNAVASPVDRFVKPLEQEVAPSPLNGLAQALSKINPALQQYLGRTHDDYVQRETAAGMKAESMADSEAVFEANREGWLKLIKEARASDKTAGTINGERIAAASPHFQRGFMKARAERLGLTLQDHLEEQLKSNPQIEVDGRMVSLKSVDDPDAIRAWVQQTKNAYADSHGLMDMDPVIFAQHFTPRVAKAQANVQSAHTEYRLQAIAAAYEAELSAGVGAVAIEGLKTGEMSGVAEGMQELLNDAVRNGMNPKKANEQVVQAVLNLARETRNTAVLGVLDNLSTGNGPLGNIGWVREEILKADEMITDDIWEEETRAYTREERRRSEDERAGLTAALTALAQDPDADVSMVVERALKFGNPSLATAVTEAQNRLQKQANEVLTDHEHLSSIRYRMLQAGANYPALEREILMMTGVSWSGPTAMGLYDDLKVAEKSTDVRNDFIVAKHVDRLTAIIQTRFQDSQFGIETVSGRENAYAAELMFQDELMEFVKDNSTASIPAVRLEAERIAHRLLENDLFADPDQFGDEGPSPLKLREAANSPSPLMGIDLSYQPEMSTPPLTNETSIVRRQILWDS